MTNPNHQATRGGGGPNKPLPVAGRSLPEWIGATPDTPAPPRVRLRVFERCGGICAISGRKIRPGDDWDLDHIIALCNGGQHRESNLQVALKAAHRAKTADDVKLRAKTDRIRLKHTGQWPAARQKIKSRGFDRRGANIERNQP